MVDPITHLGSHGSMTYEPCVAVPPCYGAVACGRTTQRFSASTLSECTNIVGEKRPQDRKEGSGIEMPVRICRLSSIAIGGPLVLLTIGDLGFLTAGHEFEDDFLTSVEASLAMVL